MNKQLSLAFLFVLVAALSVSAISASDVNVTDSYINNVGDDTSDVSVPMDNADCSSASSVLNESNVDNESSKSANSNNLSTNSDSNSKNNVLAKNSTTVDPSKTVDSKDVTKYYKGSTKYTAKFFDSYGNPLANKDVKIYVNKEGYVKTTDSNGVVSLDINRNPGTYTIIAENPITKFNLTTLFKILSTITASDVTKVYTDGKYFYATFLMSNGQALANTDIKFKINGKTYTKKTNGDGVARLSLVNLKPGTYEMISSNVDGLNVTNVVKVVSKTSSKIIASDYTFLLKDGKTIKVTLHNGLGYAPGAGKLIKFVVNGKTYTRQTNVNGVASLKLPTLKAGIYTVKYSFDGNNFYTASSASSKLIILPSNTATFTVKSTTTFSKGSGTRFVVALKSGSVPLAGKEVVFTVNGKSYIKTTDSKGLATLSTGGLDLGKYVMTYSFDGDSKVKVATGSTAIEVKDLRSTATFTVKSTTTFGKGSGTRFVVALKSGSVPLAGKEVVFTVNGKSYTKTTDSKGLATLSTGGLDLGKYVMTYSFDGDSKVKAATGSSNIEVKERTPTKIIWKSGTSFYQGSQTYKVLLQDSIGKALSGKTILLTVNGKTYSAKTASDGYATFNVNVGSGNYSVSFEFANTDNDYLSTSGVANITVEKKKGAGYGYWIYGADMKKANLNSLASQGVTDLFLNFAAIEQYGQADVESWIAGANKLGINVHIWMQTFYENKQWVNPIKNGKIDTEFFEKKIIEAQSYAKIKGVYGIHFDYLRYPGNAYKTNGGAEAISQFVIDATEAIHNINSKIIVSAALMPETTDNLKYYGQDYSVLSKYLDVVIPMIYKGNYEATSSWITKTTKWFVDNSQGAYVWAGLQGYKSDDDVTKLSASEIKDDSQAALDGRAPGVIIFRWGVTNFVDFKSLVDNSDSPNTSGSVSIDDIIAAANTLKNTIDSKNTIPKTVSVGGVEYSIAQFLYMMSDAIKKIKDGKTSLQVLPINVNVPLNPEGLFKSGSIATTEYMDIVNRVFNFIKNNNRAPNFASSSLGDIDYDSLIEMFANILVDYKTNGKLPTSIKVNNGTKDEQITVKTISIKDIVAGATNLKKYYETNKKLPDTVTAGGVKFTLAEFTYLMSKAIDQLGNSNTKAITIITGIANPSNPSGDTINSKDLSKTGYLNVALKVANYIIENKRVPNYSGSDVGKIIYYEYVDAFSRILAFYGTNNRLPNSVTISYSSGSGSDSGTSGSGHGLNEKNTETDLDKYLKATKNCQVNDANIKSIVNQVTKGLTSVKDKATAIFNYVRDKIAYAFYYNTKYGATETLSNKQGNCVDESHLLVAMFRTAGIHARYVHGTCTFSSGNPYGHVWVQVLVDGQWTVADATSSRNSLGKVANWNPNTFSLKSGCVAEIDF